MSQRPCNSESFRESDLIGKADVVEFHPLTQKSHGYDDTSANVCNGVNRKCDKWLPFPVEYKRGKPKMDDCDKIQLCAQAICLEEMLNIEIKHGALFYGQTRRREDVVFDEELRLETENAAKNVHALIESGTTPKPEYSRKCKKCSLYELCMPKISGKVSNYLMRAVEEE